MVIGVGGQQDELLGHLNKRAGGHGFDRRSLGGLGPLLGGIAEANAPEVLDWRREFEGPFRLLARALHRAGQLDLHGLVRPRQQAQHQACAGLQFLRGEKAPAVCLDGGGARAFFKGAAIHVRSGAEDGQFYG